MMENNGDCPENLSALRADGTLSKEAKDPWGKELQFACPGEENSEGFDLTSSGPDKKFGTEDDIADKSE